MSDLSFPLTVPRTRPWGILSAFRRAPAFALVLALLVIDLVWLPFSGLRFVGWEMPLLTVLAMLGLGAFYTFMRPRRRLAELGFYAAGWIGMTAVGAIATYLIETLRFPLADAWYARSDQLLHFNWYRCTLFVQQHPVLERVMWKIYCSLLFQILFSIIWFSLAGPRGRNQELLLAAIIGLLLVCVPTGLFPSLGPGSASGGRALLLDPGYLSDALRLREAGMSDVQQYSMRNLHGIVAFPSYHMVLAVLFIYAHRGNRIIFWIMAVLNTAMIFTIPSEGGHYLVDVIGGAVIAALAIFAVRAILRNDGATVGINNRTSVARNF